MSSEDLIIRQYRNRIRKKVLSTMLVGLILSVLVFLDIQVGSSSIAFKDLVDAVLKGRAGGSSASFIVWEIRLPMTFTCLFVGASLSLAGLLIQTITNNPLASPYTLGVTAGASFGAAIAITTGFALFGQIWLGVSLAALVMALTVSAFISCGRHYEFLLSGAPAVSAVPSFSGNRANYLRLDVWQPSALLLDQRRRFLGLLDDCASDFFLLFVETHCAQ